METQLLLFLFMKSVICLQQDKKINFDITFENNHVKCTPRDENDKLAYGDQFEMTAHLPYEADGSNDVAHMRCKNGEKNILEKCTTKTHNGTSTCVVNGVYNMTTNGRWNCTYLMMKNSKQSGIKPIVLFNSDYYTQADCIINVETQDPLWFYVREPNRLKTINKTPYNANYEYVYGDKENIYVECKGPEKKQSTFEYKSKRLSYGVPLDPFSKQAEPGLDGANLTCSFKNERGSYEIKLTLKAGYIRFTGLNNIQYNSQLNNIYAYIQNEEVQIGCNTNLPCKTELKFHEAGTGPNELQREPTKFYYTFSGSESSGQCLLCTCKYSDKYGPMEIYLTFEPDKSVTTTTKRVVTVTPRTELTTTATTTMRVVTVTPQTIPHARFDISIDGPSSMFLSDAEKNYYTYEYTSEDKITLTCTSKYTSTKNIFPIINHKLQLVNIQKPEQNTSEKVTFNRNTNQHKIEHTFKINGNGTIVCSQIDDTDKNPHKPSITATVKYMFISPTETQDKLNGNFLKENFTVILGVSAAVVVICAGVCAVMVLKKKSAASVQPQEDNYVNLENNQHTYNTLPVPASQTIRQNPPTVEANYSEPKDLNDMSDAMYADPNRFKETTYAEPYIQQKDLYAKPIPKSQRKPKIADDPNYSNMFGKDYVNSLRK